MGYSRDDPNGTAAHPPVKKGARVKTTQSNRTPEADAREWTKGALAARRWGVEGDVIEFHDSHGLCYEVRHADGSVGCYEPGEFETLWSR